MPKKTIADLCREAYHDDNLAAWMEQQVAEAKTGDKILSGERVLPHPEDAMRNYQIANGTFYTTEKEREQADYLSKLEARLQQLESLGVQQKPKE